MENIQVWSDHVILHFWHCANMCKSTKTTSEDKPWITWRCDWTWHWLENFLSPLCPLTLWLFHLFWNRASELAHWTTYVMSIIGLRESATTSNNWKITTFHGLTYRKLLQNHRHNFWNLECAVMHSCCKQYLFSISCGMISQTLHLHQNVDSLLEGLMKNKKNKYTWWTNEWLFSFLWFSHHKHIASFIQVIKVIFCNEKTLNVVHAPNFPA